jgi:hypothetical protein
MMILYDVDDVVTFRRTQVGLLGIAVGSTLHLGRSSRQPGILQALHLYLDALGSDGGCHRQDVSDLPSNENTEIRLQRLYGLYMMPCLCQPWLLRSALFSHVHIIWRC